MHLPIDLHSALGSACCCVSAPVVAPTVVRPAGVMAGKMLYVHLALSITGRLVTSLDTARPCLLLFIFTALSTPDFAAYRAL